VDQLGKVVDSMTMLEDRFEATIEQLHRCEQDLEWYYTKLLKYVPSSEIERELRKHRRSK
jgi:ferritin-like metal-binding protein YciE